VSAEARIGAAVVRQAVLDLTARSPHLRRRAEAFFAPSAGLRFWSSVMDVSPDTISRLAHRAVSDGRVRFDR
jgi:hypothetical protein